MFVDFNILNQLGSPAINSNTFANRPAAGQTGRLFVSTDTFEIYRDNGTSWDLIGGPGAGTITGTGTATQVAYFTGSQTIGSSANLFWDNTAGALGINTATPGAELDVHGTGIMVQLNSTTATANSLLAFQRSGTGLWRIGDVYNGGTNYFEIFNTVLSTTGLRMDAATNKTEFLAQENYTTGQAQGNLFTYNLTVPGGTTFTSPNAIHSVNSYLNLSLGGNITTPAGTRQGLEGNSRISFTGAGTLTMTQGSTVRAWSSLSSVYSFNGSAVGTITHLAGLRVCFPDNTGSAVNITNNYGILINDQTAGTGTINYTNRWGIYQEGASDLNYFNGNLLIKSTTNSGEALQVNGSAKATNVIISEQSAPATPAASTGILYAKTDNLPYYKNDLGTEYSLTAPENLTNVIFRQLGSQFIGYPVANPSLFITANALLVNQTAIFVAYYLQFDQTITGVKFFQSVQGVYTANNYNGVGLYTFNAGTMTLVASSTNDGNIWKGTAATWQTKAFSSTYVATAGIYFVSLLYNSSAETTAPQIGMTTAGSTAVQSYDFSNSVKLNSTIAGQTALPATQLQSGTTGFTRNVTLLLY
jgi:hypothetical protein